MSLKDLVICAGIGITPAASLGALTITNPAISATDVALASFSTGVGVASAAVQIRAVCANGSATFTAVDAAGAVVAAAVSFNYLVVKPISNS